MCLERGADLHMAQLMPLPLTLSCFIIIIIEKTDAGLNGLYIRKIQIGFTVLVLAHMGSPGKRAVKRVCVRVCVCVCVPLLPVLYRTVCRKL